MNKTYFIARVKQSLFGGKISKTQIDGLLRIVAYRDEKWPNMSDEELAYVLATVKHETAHTMQPVTEYGSKAYLRGKPYWPWIGRGLVQITWKANYARYNINKPEDALTWPVALHVLFHGMIFGTFTGKRLAGYIISGARPDYVGARRIINGTDKAALIAGYAKAFLDALKQAKETPAPTQQVQAPDLAQAAPKPAEPITGEPEDQATGKPMVQSTTVWAQIGQFLATGGAALLTALGAIDWKTALALGGIGLVAGGAWVIHARYLRSRDGGV